MPSVPHLEVLLATAKTHPARAYSTFDPASYILRLSRPSDRDHIETFVTGSVVDAMIGGPEAEEVGDRARDVDADVAIAKVRLFYYI